MKGSLLVIARDDPADLDGIRTAERSGVTVLRLALLRTEPGRDGARMRDWLKDGEGSAVAWTSKRAGEALARLALPSRRDSLSRLSLFAVGSESAAPLRETGFTVEVPVRAEGAAALAGWMIRRQAENGFSRVAFLRGDKALPTLRDALHRAGIPVDEFEVYRTGFETPNVALLTDALRSGTEVLVAFYSPSGVEALERLLPPRALKALRETARATAIGETTHRALLDLGYRHANRFEFRGTWDFPLSKGIQSKKRKPE
jgi:uroporphyrinogen-III synthase